MRKILTSVLSVAGLLAVVLALASSPAAADKDVITVQTPTDGTAGNAGTYVVSWETQGGCDPGSGTSGASGSVTLTVADPDSDGAGDQEETGVVIDDICNYEWEVSFTNGAGAVCAATIPQAGDNRVIAGVATCPDMADVVVVVAAYDPPAIPEDTTADPPIEASDPGPSAPTPGAVTKTSFTVTATPDDDSDDDCAGDSADSKYDADTGLNSATLTVVEETAGGDDDCTYDIAVALPDGWAAVDEGNEGSVNPEAGTGDDDVDTDDLDDDDALTVTVAERNVYLVQRVAGDAGGAYATYDLADLQPCGGPGLPPALTPRAVTGGIMTTDGETVVELRTGDFNITGAINDLSPAGVPAFALDKDGEACSASVSMSGAPASCTVASNSPANLATSDDDVIIGFQVDCREPVAPEPVAPEPTEEMTEEPTEEMTEEPTEEMTEEPTEEMTEESGEGAVGLTG